MRRLVARKGSQAALVIFNRTSVLFAATEGLWSHPIASGEAVKGAFGPTKQKMRKTRTRAACGMLSSDDRGRPCHSTASRTMMTRLAMNWAK
jgi:hypothetical protein